VSHIAKAASVLLARKGNPFQLFFVRRNANLRFLGGFYAFPGGKVCSADASFPVQTPTIPLDSQGAALERYATVARELFEEAGVLLARRSDGSYPVSGETLQYLRRKLLSEELSFEQTVARLRLAVWADDFIYLGNITTPPFVPTRFDTAFFLATVPDGQHAEVWPGELDEGEFATASEMLDRWTRGECLVSPPTLAILKAIRSCVLEEVPACLTAELKSWEAGAIHPIYFAPQAQLVPLRTQGLPPSTHTNAYLIGHDPAFLLDPGSSDVEEQKRLFELLDQFHAAGGRLAGIVLTHHHPDHIGGATACARRYGAPIYAHPLTERALDGKVSVQKRIEDGEQLNLGTAADGTAPWRLEAIHTPGHASGHLAFYEPHYRSLFVADMLSTLSSVVIAPPDGDLTAYLDSLERLKKYDCRLLMPAHGSPSARPLETIDEAIAHRRMREEQLLAALASGPRSVPELAEELYKGLPPAMMRFAHWQVLAGLQKLEREAKAESADAADTQRWSRKFT
jgi:glyoxylase-like metal-dependent hydrolase (beta-lactamase superfamily II)/8-oxo-dGTP pyrophosphatase MutT (NUDIX family)